MVGGVIRAGSGIHSVRFFFGTREGLDSIIHVKKPRS
jgi:hypothetical protein